MGGFFGVVSQGDCVSDLFYGTDYHSHLGTRRGGLAVRGKTDIHRSIHDITNAQFRSKFETDVTRMEGRRGVGVISDYEDQPLIIGSHLGTFAVATVGVVRNMNKLACLSFERGHAHFSEMSGGEINQTELVATIVAQEESFEAGIARAQAEIEGSCSILILADRGLYAARDRLGRTPVVLGSKEGSRAVTFETCAFLNLGYQEARELGPGEIVLVTEDGAETLRPPGDRLQICAFLWIYYGYPASRYEGRAVEVVRNRCGAALARADDVKPDLVAGIPDSGTGHAIGYADEAKVPYRRPFVKYTPTWPRSFMPQDQSVRNLVARMKLLPVNEVIRGRRLLFCEDSIVRGTQLRDTIQTLYDFGAREIHMRPACPPLLFGCRFLNFSRSRSELDLAARRAVGELEGQSASVHPDYLDPESERYGAMVERIRQRLSLTSLRYQRLPDMVEAIGLPRDRLCTYCWDAAE